MEVTVEEALEKICPLNKEKCIVGNCPKWEYTKTKNIYVSEPENSCKCGDQTSSYRLCWVCGDIATPEKKHIARSEIDFGELPEYKKEGICTL